MHKGFKCLDISTRRVYIFRDVVFDERIFPFVDLHANDDTRLRSEIELLSPTLFDSSMIYGSTTIPCTDVANSSNNPATNPDQNLVENTEATPVLHVVIQGETGMLSQEDLPAPATDGPLGSAVASASAPADPSIAATRTAEELPGDSHVQAADTKATRCSSTGSGPRGPDIGDTRRTATGSDAREQPATPASDLSATGAGGSSAPDGSGARL
jgi:hypothetical protein